MPPSPRSCTASDRDHAVASIVGTLLAVLGLVLVTGGLLAVVLSDTPEDPVTAQLEPEREGDSLSIAHKGGESLRTNGTVLVVEAAGATQRVDLEDFVDQIGHTFDAGESVCLAGDHAGCSDDWAGQEITQVRLVHESQVRTSWEGSFSAPGGTLPDLTATYEGTNPSDPNPGQTVHFRATIGNAGYADVANNQDVTIEFHLDGVFHSSKTIKGAQLRSGDTPSVSSETWTATVGTHTVRVVADAGDDVKETREDNNEDTGDATANEPPVASFTHVCNGQTCTFDASTSTDVDGSIQSYAWELGDGTTYTGETIDHTYSSADTYQVNLTVTDDGGGSDDATAAVTASPGIPDPGHAYEDADNDGLFDAGTDEKIDDAEVQDGLYEASHSGWGLVLPASLGEIDAPAEIKFVADGTVRVWVDLISSTEQITVESKQQDIHIHGITFQAGKQVHVKGDAGYVDLGGSTFDDITQHVLVTAGDGIDGSNVSIDAGTYVDFTSDGGTIDAADATYRAQTENINMETKAPGDFLANRSKLHANNQLVVKLSDGDTWLEDANTTSDTQYVELRVGDASNSVHLDDLWIEDSDDDALISPGCPTVTGSPSHGVYHFAGGCPVPDPGQAFEDENGDGLYDPSTDLLVADSEIEDGVYSLKNKEWGFVIPDSVGAIHATDKVVFTGKGTMRVDVDLTAENNHIELNSGENDLIVSPGVTLTAGKYANLLAAKGDVTLSGVEVTSENENVHIDATGPIDASGPGTVIDAAAYIDWESISGSIDVTDATLTAGANHLDLIAKEAGPILANGSTLESHKTMTITAGDGDVWIEDASLTSTDDVIVLDIGTSSNTVHVEGAAISEPMDNDTANLDPDGATIDGTPASGDVHSNG